jgi:hypothetical protein
VSSRLEVTWLWEKVLSAERVGPPDHRCGSLVGLERSGRHPVVVRDRCEPWGRRRPARPIDSGQRRRGIVLGRETEKVGQPGLPGCGGRPEDRGRLLNRGRQTGAAQQRAHEQGS